MTMKDRIESLLLKVLSNRMSRQANAVELKPKYILNKFIDLKEDERNAINNIWKCCSSQIDYRYWMVYKGVFQFNPFLMPDDIYVRNILRVLNPMRKCYCLQNKNMYDILYSGLKKPSTLINCYDGHIFDLNNKEVSQSEVITVLKRNSESPSLILKISANSCSGNGVSILDLNDEESCVDKIRAAGYNYVVQEILKQSEKTKRFNPSSLNTFRVNTLNINGHITVENIMFRHGRGDRIVDNAGAGGTCVGFSSNGKVIGIAIDANLNKYEVTPFGSKYTDVTIPELQAISDTAISAHSQYLPMMGHCAWDFALDHKDEPVFIEVNLGWPGIMTEQLSSCRPIFGDRIYEVINYAKSNKHMMSFTDFIGNWT